MRGFPYYMVLKSSRPLSERAFVAIAMAIATLAEESSESSVSRTFDNFEIYLSRTGKYGLLGSFGGEELTAVYADESGYEVRVSFLANIQKIVGSRELPN